MLQTLLVLAVGGVLGVVVACTEGFSMVQQRRGSMARG
jgi:hypothetical protein